MKDDDTYIRPIGVQGLKSVNKHSEEIPYYWYKALLDPAAKAQKNVDEIENRIKRAEKQIELSKKEMRYADISIALVLLLWVYFRK